MVKKLLVAGIVAVVGAFVWSTAPASAHHPEVRITACPGPQELQNFVDVTAYAFEIPDDWTVDHRINTEVRLDVVGDGVNYTTTGQFVAPDYSFTARVEVPDAVGKTITARVTALAGWGTSGDYPSTWDTEEATITIPLCADSSTTTSTTSTTIAPTSTQAPSTTEAPTSTQAPSSTVPTEVEGITQVRPQVPGGGATDETAAPGAQQLAFSGGETGPLVLGGGGLLAVGAALLVATRRRSA